MNGSESTNLHGRSANNLAMRTWSAPAVNEARLVRLLRLARVLEAGTGNSVADLAQVFGVSRRTLFRDMDILRRAGVEFTYDRKAHRFSAEDTTVLPPHTLNADEAVAVLLIARYLSNSRVFPCPDVAMTAALKLESLIPLTIRDSCSTLLMDMEIRPEPSSDASAIRGALNQLQTALNGRNKIVGTYDYYGHDKPLDLVLHPYRLVHMNRGWHLVAFAEHASRVQTYRVERFVGLGIIKEKYRVYCGFKLEEYLRGAWVLEPGEDSHHVIVQFDRKRAGEVEEIQWHKTQRIVYNDDGSMLFEVDVDGLEEISWWIMGYGDHALVLEPPELRDFIAQRVNRMQANYADATSCGDPPEVLVRSTG